MTLPGRLFTATKTWILSECHVSYHSLVMSVTGSSPLHDKMVNYILKTIINVSTLFILSVNYVYQIAQMSTSSENSGSYQCQVNYLRFLRHVSYRKGLLSWRHVKIFLLEFFYIDVSINMLST